MTPATEYMDKPGEENDCAAQRTEIVRQHSRHFWESLLAGSREQTPATKPEQGQTDQEEETENHFHKDDSAGPTLAGEISLSIRKRPLHFDRFGKKGRLLPIRTYG